MRTLIYGVTGLLGHALSLKFSQIGDVYGTWHKRRSPNTNDIQLDFNNTKKTIQWLEYVKPDLCINAVALSNPDDCEQNPDVAYKINTHTLPHLCEACHRLNIPLVAFSSDYVFSGHKSSYTESDEQDPIQTYGRSKSIMERIVCEYPYCTVLRMGFLYGPSHKPDFIYNTLTNLYRGQTIYLCGHQLRQPLLTTDVAEIVYLLHQKQQAGLFNITGPEIITKYGWALQIARSLEYPQHLIMKDESTDLERAKRPTRSILNTYKLQSTIPHQFYNIQDGILRRIQDIYTQGI